MKCPKCKTGELVLYKETEKAYHFMITKDNKIYKHPFSSNEFETEKDYLECKNEDCGQWFDYDLDKKGRVIEKLLRER